MKPRHRIQRHQHRRENEKNQPMTHGHLQRRAFKSEQESDPQPKSKLDFHFANLGVIQPKLAVGAPNSPAEQEADAVAGEVVKTITDGQAVQYPAKHDHSQGLPRPDLAASLPLQRNGGVGAGPVSDEYESQLSQSFSGGSPIEAAVRKPLEGALNAKLDHLRIHTGAQAEQLTTQVQAKAMTVKNHLYFNKDEYQPKTPGGLELLSHEVTHTFQQGASQQNAGETAQRQIDPVQVTAPTISRQPGYVLQARLMSIADFQQRKKEATTQKGLVFKSDRSTTDFENLHQEYYQALNAKDFATASKKISKLQKKFQKMKNKDYWVSDDLKVQFIKDLEQSLDEEIKWLAMQEVDTFFEERGRGSKDQVVYDGNNDDAILKTTLYAQQREVIVEALGRAWEVDPEIKTRILKEKGEAGGLIEKLCNHFFKQDNAYMIEALNVIGHETESEELENATFEAEIRKLVLSDKPDDQKVVEAAQLMFGMFEWNAGDGFQSEEAYVKGNGFRNWLSDPNAPEPAPNAKMNCWDGVLFSAYKAGVVTKQALQAVYPGGNCIDAALNKMLGFNRLEDFKVDPDNTKPDEPPFKGDIVCYWTGKPSINSAPEHVTLATGNDYGVMSLWKNGTGYMMGQSTVGDLWAPHIKYITYAAPDFKASARPEKEDKKSNARLVEVK
ncbi:MAG: DUF4157 domain-containing protein [Cyanobacteria bacterium P01_G01_bin.38]